MAISTPGVGGGTPDFKLQGLSKDFWGELKFSISGPLGGSKSFASSLFGFFFVGILMFVSSLQGMFMAWKFGMGFVRD